MPSIIRVLHNKDRPYLTIAVSTIRDARRDLRALGLLVDLLARPDDWHVSPRVLARELGVSMSTIYRLLDRLIILGYVSRVDVTRRLENGTFERRTSYSVFEGKIPAAGEIPQEGAGLGVAYGDIPF